MSRFVPEKRVSVSSRELRAGRTVAGLTWDAVGNNANWLRGRGGMPVPACTPQVELPYSGGTTYNFRLMGITSSTANERVWWFGFSGSFRADEAPMVAAPIGGTAKRMDIGAFAVPGLASYREAVPSPSAGAVELTFSVTPESLAYTGNTRLDYVHCCEVPRPSLLTAESGTDMADLEPGDPITETAVVGLATVARDTALGRRTLFHLLRPVEVPYSITSSTFASLASFPQCGLGRTLFADTKRSIKVMAYCRMVSGGSGEIRVVPSKGSTLTATGITNSSFAWVDCGNFDLDAEDLTTSNGLPSGTFETIDVQTRRLTSGTFEVATVSLYEV